jgi:hypothetical protein
MVAVVSPFASAMTAVVGLMMALLVVVWAVVAVAVIGVVAVAARLVALLVGLAPRSARARGTSLPARPAVETSGARL